MSTHSRSAFSAWLASAFAAARTMITPCRRRAYRRCHGRCPPLRSRQRIRCHGAEPMFQTFDETSDPTLGAGRVALLARLACQPGPRRLLRAARRRASGRVCGAPLRTAEVADRLQRLGRRGAGDDRPRLRLRRRPLHAAGARRGRPRRVLHREPDRHAAAGMAEAEHRQGRAARLRSLAAHDRRGQGAEGGGRGEGRGARRASTPTRSMRCGPTSRRRRWSRSRSIRSSLPASSPGTSWHGWRRRSKGRAPRMPC